MFREPISELSAQLRATVGAELVEEWEITELETEQGRLRARTLPELWEQAMHRGDRVKASGSFGTCSGTVEYVGRDYAVLLGSGTSWDIRLTAASFVVTRSSDGGHTTTGGSRTLRARLAEYEASGETVTVHSAVEVTMGSLTVVAADHVIVDGDVDTVVPMDRIQAISRVIGG